MKTRYLVIFAWLLFISVFGSLGCECIGGPRHAFEENVLFTPEHLQYHIGDTIWIDSKFSCRGLLNVNTGEEEDYCGVDNLSLEVWAILLEPYQQDTLASNPAVKNFNFQSIEGHLSFDSDKFVTAFFQVQNDQYSLKIAIVPREIGTYRLAAIGGGSYQLPDSKKCDTGTFSFSLENHDNHIFLYEAFKGAQNVTEDERLYNYCFEVIQ